MAGISTPTNVNFFEIVQTGTPSVSAITSLAPSAGQYAFGENYTTVPHNLGYSPAILAYIFVNGEYLPVPSTELSSGNTYSAVWYTYSAYVDATNVVVGKQILSYGSGVTDVAHTFKYYLLRETAN